MRRASAASPVSVTEYPAPRERAVLAHVPGLEKPVTYSETKIPLSDLVRKVAAQAALEKVVDRLLASPEFGVRWARHWLDGVRYAVPLARKCLALFVNADLLPETPPTLEGITALKGALPPDVYPLVYDDTTDRALRVETLIAESLEGDEIEAT